MSRNKEAYFSVKPEAHIQRSRFDRSCEKKFSFNGSYLIPFYWDEVLPNDTFSIDMATLMRMTTPLNPVMDNANLDVYFFFVPNRLLWTHWEDFITGGATPSNWETPATYTIPKIIFGKKGSGGTEVKVRVGSVADYLGVPAEQSIGQDTTNGVGLNALPFRAYYRVFNDWFRDENYVDPMLENDGDSSIDYAVEGTAPQEIDTNSTQAYINNPSYVHGDHCLKVAKYHDYFTSVLPAPQKGPDVLIPGLDNQSIGAIGKKETNNTAIAKYIEDEATGNIFFSSIDGDVIGVGGSDIGAADVYMDGPGGTSSDTLLQNVVGTMFNPGATINALRTAFQLQRYYEKLSGAGRYIEWLNTFFGAKSPDARLQRSEYLGGKRIPINMSQVLQQSATTGTETLGKTGAYSLTRDRSSMFTKSFVEHGILLGVCCVRTEETYSQGIAREFLRDTHFDYYNPVFANLGNQAVRGIELYSFLDANPENADVTLGYQEAWAEYRYKPSTCAGYMRPYISGGYSTWTYGMAGAIDDVDPGAFSIDEEFITSNNTGLNRTLAVSGSTIHQFLADVYVKANVVRPMPLYSIPGLADHH